MNLKNKALLVVGYELHLRYTDARRICLVDLKIGFTKSAK